MGATLQRTLMHKEKGKILTDGSDPSLTKAYEKDLKAKGKQPELSQLRLVSGKNILSNTQVNVLSSLLTSIITVIIGNYIIWNELEILFVLLIHKCIYYFEVTFWGSKFW